MIDKSVKKDLDNVLDICKDGAEGYKKAADAIDSSEAGTVFRRLSQQRRLFAEELKNDVREHGLDLDDSGTVKGFLHRNWMDLKSKVTGNDTSTVIETAKTGEKKALDAYDDAINNENMPDYLVEKLSGQRQMIRGAIDQLESFKISPNV
ncbi:MAG: ferritin-like domain-containing protein [Candidatus Cyclobacteriaceae bacterium M2_1C_046]